VRSYGFGRERFARGEGSTSIARDPRVSVRSVQRWRHAWVGGGPRALRSQRPASLPRLSAKQFAQLEVEPAKGPAAHGWEDQRWTPGRITTVIGRRFHPTCTIQGVHKLLVRNGWSCHIPARRAMERHDDAAAGWVREVWPRAEGRRRTVEPGRSSRTKPTSPGHRRTPEHGHHQAAPRSCASAAVPAHASRSPH
jgi:transposase